MPTPLTRDQQREVPWFQEGFADFRDQTKSLLREAEESGQSLTRQREIVAYCAHEWNANRDKLAESYPDLKGHLPAKVDAQKLTSELYAEILDDRGKEQQKSAERTHEYTMEMSY